MAKEDGDFVGILFPGKTQRPGKESDMLTAAKYRIARGYLLMLIEKRPKASDPLWERVKRYIGFIEGKTLEELRVIEEWENFKASDTPNVALVPTKSGEKNGGKEGKDEHEDNEDNDDKAAREPGVDQGPHHG